MLIQLRKRVHKNMFFPSCHPKMDFYPKFSRCFDSRKNIWMKILQCFRIKKMTFLCEINRALSVKGLLLKWQKQRTAQRIKSIPTRIGIEEIAHTRKGINICGTKQNLDASKTKFRWKKLYRKTYLKSTQKTGQITKT